MSEKDEIISELEHLYQITWTSIVGIEEDQEMIDIRGNDVNDFINLILSIKKKVEELQSTE